MTRSALVVGAAFVVVAALVAAALPLATYTVTLAAFGLAHVLAELRYLDGRFGHRVPRREAFAVGVLLTGVVLLRGLGVGGALGRGPATSAELVLVAALAATAAPLLLRRARPYASLSALAVAALVAGVALAPVETIVVLAVIHNLTPVGFLAERLRGAERRRAMAACVVAFGAVPFAILSGVPFRALDALGIAVPEASLLAAGSLSDHVGVYVPGTWAQAPWAMHAFAAAVYLQILHYATVLHVLPRLAARAGEGSGALAPWPRPTAFRRVVAALAALAFVGFALSFRDARAFYGILAAVHAWVEVPLLLVAPALLLSSTVRATPDVPRPTRIPVTSGASRAR